MKSPPYIDFYVDTVVTTMHNSFYFTVCLSALYKFQFVCISVNVVRQYGPSLGCRQGSQSDMLPSSRQGSGHRRQEHCEFSGH